MNPEATCLVYILQLDSVTAVSKSPAELWGSYLQAPWAASQNTEMFLCSSYYRWLGAVWVMFSVLCRTCAFHWQHKKQHERCDPFAFEISIRSRCMPDMLSRLQVLWGRNCWDASVLCSDGAIVLLRKWWYFYLSGDSQSFWVFPPSIHFCLKDQTVFFKSI